MPFDVVPCLCCAADVVVAALSDATQMLALSIVPRLLLGVVLWAEKGTAWLCSLHEVQL